MQRDSIFYLNVRRRPPLYRQVNGVTGRINVWGNPRRQPLMNRYQTNKKRDRASLNFGAIINLTT